MELLISETAFLHGGWEELFQKLVSELILESDGPESESWILGPESWDQAWVRSPGSWILGPGPWVLNPGSWVLRVLGPGS